MECNDTNNLNQVIASWGPFIAALITGIMVYMAARVQSKSTLDAAKAQSDATLAAAKAQSDSTLAAAKSQSDATITTMTESLNSQYKIKRLEALQDALTDIILNLYLIERNPNSYFQNEKGTLHSIARLLTTLGSSSKENSVRHLLSTLRYDLINKGDVAQVARIRSEIEIIMTSLISDIETN